jgi:hypothetical protein
MEPRDWIGVILWVLGVFAAVRPISDAPTQNQRLTGMLGVVLVSFGALCVGISFMRIVSCAKP